MVSITPLPQSSSRGVDVVDSPRLRSRSTSTVIPPREIAFGNLLASGANGEVFKATFNGRSVAVKKFHSISPHEFCNEVKILQLLQHANIITFLGNMTEPFRCIVTELMEMGDLQAYIRKSRLPFASLLSIAIQIAEGMSYVHRTGLIHRDLKCGNVMLTSSGIEGALVAKVMDFGDACEMSNVMSRRHIGTARWTAPEMFQGKSYNEKVDVYAFGVLLWELLSNGAVPFSEYIFDSQVEDAVLRGERPTIPPECKCPLGMRSLIESCWNQIPSLRPTFLDIVPILRDFQSREVDTE